MDANRKVKVKAWPASEQSAWVFLRYLLRSPNPLQSVGWFEDNYDCQQWLFGAPLSRISPRARLDRCRAQFRSLDTKSSGRAFYSNILRHVGQHFGLNETERRIIWLAVLLYRSKAFREITQYFDLDASCTLDVAQVIATMIDARDMDVLRAIGPSGHLAEIGLIEPVDHYMGFDDYLNIPHRLRVAVTEAPSPVKAMEAFLQPAHLGTLSADDFPHLQNDFVHVCRYLQAALQHKARGVNVLLYGPPGTGKTELAGLIARHLDVPLYAVPEDQSTRYGEDEQSRLSAFRMSQALLSATRSIILFDDVEDGILDFDRSLWRAKTSGKAMLNTLLESNPVPAIWCTNVADRFEESHTRRFDLAIGFKLPPRSVRISMIDKHLHDLPLSSSFKATLADDRDLTPAQIGKIARVVGSVASNEPHANDLEPLAVHLYRAVYKLRSGRDPDPPGNDVKSVQFDADWVNSSVSAVGIIDMFRNATGLRACFNGLPGTGKTALAENIAQVIDKPLLVKRASDLLRPFLGETEQLMRAMFEEAMDEGSVLLLDEADSFLGTRENAVRSWEITQTNEMLVSIERFKGHFIATTNAVDVLDTAAHRRFDLKVSFFPLRPDQRLQMFDALIKRLGISYKANSLACRRDVVNALKSMSQLTPGDFAVVGRRLSLGPVPMHMQIVLDALSDEHSYKHHRGRSIGFVA
jgi:SpoVK/Ycf46/Vps4 family AAA+-type ATPase